MAPTPSQRLQELSTLFEGDTHVYIDYANIRRCCNIDLKKLRSVFHGTGKVKCIRFYFGTIVGDKGSEGFIARARKEGFDVETKPVKFMNLSIDVSSVGIQSTSILQSFVNGTLIRALKVEAVEYLNAQLLGMNQQGTLSLPLMKCNFDVEIATDMRLDHALNKAQTYCLFSGDSDFAHPLLRLLNEGRKAVVISKGVATELNDLRGDGLVVYDLRKLKDLICR